MTSITVTLLCALLVSHQLIFLANAKTDGGVGGDTLAVKGSSYSTGTGSGSYSKAIANNDRPYSSFSSYQSSSTTGGCGLLTTLLGTCSDDSTIYSTSPYYNYYSSYYPYSYYYSNHYYGNYGNNYGNYGNSNTYNYYCQSAYAYLYPSCRNNNSYGYGQSGTGYETGTVYGTGYGNYNNYNNYYNNNGYGNYYNNGYYGTTGVTYGNNGYFGTGNYYAYGK